MSTIWTLPPLLKKKEKLNASKTKVKRCQVRRIRLRRSLEEIYVVFARSIGRNSILCVRVGFIKSVIASHFRKIKE